MSISLEQIESSISKMENIGNSLFQISEYIEKIKALKFNKEAIIRQYYFEVCQNLEFISLLKLEEKRDFIDVGPEFEKIMNCISIDMAIAIMYLNNSWAYRKVYKEFLKIEPEKDDIFKEKDEEENVKNLYEAMVFTIKKINILKLISSSGLSADNLHNIYVRDRLNNIYANLLIIRKGLKKLIDF